MTTPNLPSVYDLLNETFEQQEWVQPNSYNATPNGQPTGPLAEINHRWKTTAEQMNGISAVLIQVSQVFRGAVMPTALQIATYFGLPLYTTAELTDPLAAQQGPGATAYNTDLESIVTSNGTTWAAAGGAASLGDGGARSVFGRAANSAGVRADIAGAGTANAPAILSDDGTTVAFRSLSLISDEILYDQDYAALSGNTFADGPEVIGAHTWTASNVAAATSFGGVGGQGIVFDAAATSTVYTTATRSAANIGIPILDLIPSFDPLRTYVIDAYFATLTLGSVANRVLVCLDNNGAGTDHLSGGGPHGDNFGTQIESTTSAATPRGAHNVVGVRISPEGVAAYASTYASGFPTYALAGSYQPHATQNFTPSMDPTGTRFVIAFITGEAGGAMAATLRRSRVRRIR